VSACRKRSTSPRVRRGAGVHLRGAPGRRDEYAVGEPRGDLSRRVTAPAVDDDELADAASSRRDERLREGRRFIQRRDDDGDHGRRRCNHTDHPVQTSYRMPDGAATGDKRVESRDAVVIRFAGDSGDGMQVTGMQFTTESALAGNDLATLPDFPAEIRAPAGTLAGVSAFQLNFSSREVFTPGDDLDVLVAMNPAALRVNVDDLKPGGILIVDREGFNEQNLKKADYENNPLENGSLARYQVFQADVTRLTTAALKEMNLSARTVFRCRNFFCLGLTSWLYHRPVAAAEAWITDRFRKTPELVEANLRALRAGHAFGENSELFAVSYDIKPATIRPGRYRNITGNTATALGFIAAAQRAGRPLFLGSYPITPASDVLHELSGLKQFDVYTFQAEDEIAGIGAALGAAFGGSIAITTTSGPGMNLKAETVGLALAVELPLVITDIQRAGPSTGMPTKTEQADLMMAMYGRHGEAPVPILAAATPADCFAMAFEAVRIAVRYMTPCHPPDRRLPRERRGAVAPARRRRPAGGAGPVPERPGRLLPIPS
jgi:2-oxoglutarate ferredoxin oxidoreductase subunit alpha